MSTRKDFTLETVRIVVVVAVMTAVLLFAKMAWADSLTQVTLPSGQNCQVSVIAGQTYVNC